MGKPATLKGQLIVRIEITLAEYERASEGFGFWRIGRGDAPPYPIANHVDAVTPTETLMNSLHIESAAARYDIERGSVGRRISELQLPKQTSRAELRDERHTIPPAKSLRGSYQPDAMSRPKQPITLELECFHNQHHLTTAQDR